MKKAIFLSALVLGGITTHAQSTWSLGLSASSLGNYSKFSGGMTNAHANFHHREYASGSFDFVARKSVSEHWSFQTGFGFSTIGFNFALAQNYSLLKNDQYINASASTGVFRVPASIIYHTKLNCRNWRWFVGGGLSALFGGESSTITLGTATAEDNTTLSLEQQYTAPAFTTVNGHLMGGIEKVFKKGSMLSFGLLLNGGFTTLASTEIKYTLDGTDYNHTFTNNGHYGGFFITYYFRPLTCGKANKK